MKITTNDAIAISPVRFRCFSFVLAVAALVVAAQLSWGVNGVPFRGRAEGAITNVTPDPGGGVVLTIVTEGIATHLGRFSRDEELLLDPSTNTFTGNIVFTAANGDQLVAAVVGGFISQTTATGSYTFNGGSGRFANATGEAAFTASTSDGVHVTVEFTGTLQSIGGANR